MSNPQKNKGDKFERDTKDYLVANGFRVDRTRAGWADDRGDLHGVDGFTWECKNWKTISLPLWIRELEAECLNNSTELGAVIHKKRGVTDMGEQYATFPLRMLVQLLKEAGYK
jgi:Holliday junction resolvase